jgi:hypothetical protein
MMLGKCYYGKQKADRERSDSFSHVRPFVEQRKIVVADGGWVQLRWSCSWWSLAGSGASLRGQPSACPARSRSAAVPAWIPSGSRFTSSMALAFSGE